MQLQDLRKIIGAIPASCDTFEVINLDNLKAEANGFVAVNVPMNHVAINLQLGQVMLVDDKQASIIKIAGKVPVKPVTAAQGS
jgi:hypothetical protein